MTPRKKQSAKSGAVRRSRRKPAAEAVRRDFSWLAGDDLHLFNEGTHYRLYQKLGAHWIPENDGGPGFHFAVWAPSARYVSVIGDFNDWTAGEHTLQPADSSGIWQGFIPGLEPGMKYKYHVESEHHEHKVDKADPFGFHHEQAPRTASILWPLDYEWGDARWMQQRAERNTLKSPISIYEVHLGSWRRQRTEDGDRWLNYREMAPLLADYVRDMGFTHVEFLPVMEHPFYGSWGYQITGYFAPTSRYGTPQDFMYLVDYLHQRDIGVILDWVPSHFPVDEHGLAYFDGTHLMSHADPQQGWHPDWTSHIYNYGRHEVRSFLISSAMFWLDVYHADGLRVDAVASMLYLDYSRKEGEWIPNVHGGRENLDAIDFLRTLNRTIYDSYPGVQTIAEESTAWPMVSRPTYVGGLGFGLKWDMGWMHDTLSYMQHDPIHRHYHHNNLTFRMLYAFHENFVLPLSHDEVVHGKSSLLGQMPGDDWKRFANLRVLLGNQFLQPGKKLLFMGGEFGHPDEWNHDESLPWHLLEQAEHQGIRAWVRDLNRLYGEEPGLHEWDCDPAGFEWVDADDADNSVISFLRRGDSPEEQFLAVFNLTPMPRSHYQVGVPKAGYWKELLNSDSEYYGGSGWGNLGGAQAEPAPCHGRPFSLSLTLPPLAVVLLKSQA